MEEEIDRLVDRSRPDHREFGREQPEGWNEDRWDIGNVTCRGGVHPKIAGTAPKLIQGPIETLILTVVLR
jgi:hypothetical protein